MFKLLKAILMLIGVIALLVGAGIYFTFNSAVEAVVGDPSKFQAELQEKYKVEITVDRKRSCPRGKDAAAKEQLREQDNYLSSRMCWGETCTFGKEFDEEKPSYAFPVFNNIGECKVFNASPKYAKVSKINYGKVTVGKDYLKSKGINVDGMSLNEVLSQDNTQSGGIIASRMQINGNYTFSIKYDVAPASDVVKFAGQDLEIVY